MKKYKWIWMTVLGSAIYACGFSLFLQPNEVSPGGVSGLALVISSVFGVGSVGTLTILMNLPLFAIGGAKIGKKFFIGSLFGMLASSILIDVVAGIPMPALEPLMAAIYGGVLCGLGLGVVFVSGGSTGGMDIVVRLLKLRYRNVPIGQLSMSMDAIVAILTGLAFQDVTKALYTGVTIYICGKALDMVVYRFDFSHVALIITGKYEEIAGAIGKQLDRGATFLHGEGSYTHRETKVVLAAVKKSQITELKEVVMEIDPHAFVIVQEAHQVLGDGFSNYSKHAL